MKKEIKRVEMDLVKIFLTPPNTARERITLILMLVATFVMFFGPLCFTDVHPAKAILLACLPALSISWGWMVLLNRIKDRERNSAPDLFIPQWIAARRSRRKGQLLPGLPFVVG